MNHCLISGFATRLLNQGPNPRNGKKSDQAHPPIHPTKFDSLSGFSRKFFVQIVASEIPEFTD